MYVRYLRPFDFPQVGDSPPDAAFTGSLGDGTGKWELFVLSWDGPLHVMSLLSTTSGHLTNLSQ